MGQDDHATYVEQTGTAETSAEEGDEERTCLANGKEERDCNGI